MTETLETLMTAPCLWDPKTGRIYTVMIKGADGQRRSAWGGLTLPEMIAAGEVSADAYVVSSEEATALSVAADRARYCTGPSEITAERFDDALNVLPPCRWVRNGWAESFYVSERLCGDIVSWYVRIHDKFYEINESATLTNAEVIALCKS